MTTAYTEDMLVQQTTADYLEEKIGWKSVYTYNNEDFGPNSLLGRGSDREVILTRILRERLIRLNPGLPGTAYDDAVQQITAIVVSQTILATNREKHGLIRDGVQVTFRDDKGERVRERLRIFDFETPENNHFLCVRELWVRADLYRRRADIVGFVNGLPLLFIECKNIYKNLKVAYEQNFSDYKDTVPHLFHHNITADKRLDQVARDFVRHYSKSWEGGKAMLVCIDKVTCLRMYDLIAAYWKRHSASLEASLNKIDPARQDKLVELQARIEWMGQTRIAVVISEEQGEVDKFRKWGIDIKPHRQLIKEGIDLPASMRGKPRFNNMHRMELDEAFKEEEHPFRIAIVCAMWLTGFDVPSLSTLYLDKPLKAHTLMQAIARANRVNEGKNNGLIVDYCGILKHLRRALATFAGTHVEGQTGGIDPARPEDELLDDLAKAIAFVRAFVDERGASLDDVIDKTGFERNAAIVACKEAANENDETRKRFEVMCREVFKKFKTCININGVNAHRANRDAVNIVYKSLRQDREQADIIDIIRQLQAVVDGAIETTAGKVTVEREPYDISRIDFDRLKQEFERSPRQKTIVQNLKQVVEIRLQRLLQQNPLRTDFQQHYEEIVAAYNREKDQVTIEKTFEALLKLVQELDEEESRAIREGLDEESLAVFDLLKKPDLSTADIKRVKKVAVSLLDKLKDEKLRVEQWRDKETTRDAVRITIHDFLWADATGLPEPYTDTDVKQRTEAVFGHVFRAYPTVPSPYYTGAAA